MAQIKPTIVIAMGSWQTPEAFSLFATKLEAEGFETIVPPLPSVGGTSSPLPSLSEDVEVIKSVVTKLSDEGREVVILCHSSGGVTGSCAVEGLDLKTRQVEGKKGGVVKMLFLAAFMIPKGKSLLEMLGGQPLPWMAIEGDKCFPVAALMPQVAFNDFSTEEAVKHIKEMQYTTASFFATPSTYEPWTHAIPCEYIFTSEDNALPFPIQHDMSAQLGPEAVTYTVKSGHCPYLSIPNELAGLIVEATV